MENPNSKSYWDRRFGSGHWNAEGGFQQTRAFAESQVPRLGLPPDFSGTLCDFGCGAGDAFPVYRAAFPRATLVGVDFSEAAIELARQRHGHLATFLVGSAGVVPPCDVIVASNVLEHLEDDEAVVRQLLRACAALHVTVPFAERLGSTPEHVHTYTLASFADLHPTRVQRFPSRGWSEYGWKKLWWKIYLRNVLRVLILRPLRRRTLQVMFSFEGAHAAAQERASVRASAASDAPAEKSASAR